MIMLLNSVRVAIIVLAISKRGYNADIKIAFGKPGTKGYEETTLKKVFITGLAKWFFANDSRFELNKEFACINSSDDWNAGPLAVVKTCNQKTGNVCYILKMVQQNGDKDYFSKTPEGTVLVDKFFINKSKDQYKRYADYFDKSHAKYLDDKLKQEEAQAEVDLVAVQS